TATPPSRPPGGCGTAPRSRGCSGRRPRPDGDGTAPPPLAGRPAGPSRRSREVDGSVVHVPESAPSATTTDRNGRSDDDKLAIKMLNDRVLVSTSGGEGERTSSGGILIPATAQMSKRLAWAEVVAVGPNVRAMEVGDRVLFNP